MARKKSKRSKVERIYGTYEVQCAHCTEEFEISVRPEFCALCGEVLDAAAD